MRVDRGYIEIQTSELSHTEDVRIHTCWISGDFALPGQPGFYLKEDRDWVLGLRLQDFILLLHSDSEQRGPDFLFLAALIIGQHYPSAPEMDTFLLLLETGTQDCSLFRVPFSPVQCTTIWCSEVVNPLFLFPQYKCTSPHKALCLLGLKLWSLDLLSKHFTD